MNKLSNTVKDLFLCSWHPFAWLIFVGFLLYAQTLFFGFSYFDDNILILEHIPWLRDFSHISNIFHGDVFHLAGKTAYYYRPFLTLSFMVNAFFSGTDPFGYHLVNVLIHLFATSLLLLLLIQLEYDQLKSFCLSLLFLVHPALVQAVAWIPGRNDSLLTVFILLSFLFFIQYYRTVRVKDLFWHLVFFVCALFTKESAVVLPLLCFFYVFLTDRGGKLRRPWEIFFTWLLCLGLWFALRSWVVETSPSFFMEWINFVFVNSPAVLVYFGKVFFPFNLSVLPILRDVHFWFGALAVVFLAALIVLSPEKRVRVIIFGFLWFVSFLFFALIRPTSPSVPADFLEHRLYLPLVGVVIVLAEINPFARMKNRQALGAFVFGIFFLTFFFVHIFYAQKFRDRLSFWKNAVQSSPHSPLAHSNLGAMYYLEGKNEAASYEYNTALSLNPQEEMTHNNLGLIFMHDGNWQQAEQNFLLEIAINPSYADAYYNFGLLRYRQGRSKEARSLMEKTLQINSAHMGARKALASDEFMNP